MRYFAKIPVGIFVAALAISIASSALASPTLQRELRQLHSLAGETPRIDSGRAVSCVLLNPTANAGSVSLRKAAKSTSAIRFQASEATRCRILRAKTDRDGQRWFEVELSSEKSLKDKRSGFVEADHLVIPQSVIPFQRSTAVLAVTEARCEAIDCDRTAILIEDSRRTPLQVGSSSIATDLTEKNIFFGRIKRTQQNDGDLLWDSSLFLYEISSRTLRRLGAGLSPRRHPSKNLVFFRNLKGDVLAVDGNGHSIRPIFSPDENVPLYRDKEGLISPPPKEPYRSQEGVVPPTVRLDRNPILADLPPPVDFVDATKARVTIPYDQARVQATVQIRIDPSW